MIAGVLDVSLDHVMSFPNVGNRKSNDYKYIKRVIKALDDKNEKVKSVAVKVLEKVCVV